MRDIKNSIDPKRDLVLERIIDVPVELVWKLWTHPDHLKVWFCPRPWRVTECKIDLQPGGLFRTVMEGPEGEKHAGDGCYLEIIENEKLVWTDVLGEGYRPNAKSNGCFDGGFTGILLIKPQGNGTKYVAIAKHATEEACKKHEEMGFQEGWGAALSQLVDYARMLKQQ